MITRLMIALGMLGLAAYLTVMAYIFVDTGWTMIGSYFTVLVLALTVFFRLPVILVPMLFVGLSNFYGLHPLLSLASLIPLLALSSSLVKGMIFELGYYFYLNKAKEENRESIKF